jgi:hypothetical protein
MRETSSEEEEYERWILDNSMRTFSEFLAERRRETSEGKMVEEIVVSQLTPTGTGWTSIRPGTIIDMESEL